MSLNPLRIVSFAADVALILVTDFLHFTDLQVHLDIEPFSLYLIGTKVIRSDTFLLQSADVLRVI